MLGKNGSLFASLMKDHILNKMQKIFSFLVIFLVVGLLHAQVQSDNIETNLSKVSFAISNLGLKVDGTLSGMEGHVNVDSKNLDLSSIEVSVKVSTINTGIAMRDRHLNKKDYFYESEYPELTFKSTAITKSKAGYVAEGGLTMRGVTKTVKIPFNLKTVDGKQQLAGSLKVKRKDYNIGGKGFSTMGNEVKVDILCVLK